MAGVCPRSEGRWVVALRVQPGHELPTDLHHDAHHHVWVLDGDAETRGQRAGRGTHIHIPAGVENGITAVGPSGLTLLYLYMRRFEPWNPAGLV